MARLRCDFRCLLLAENTTNSNTTKDRLQLGETSQIRELGIVRDGQITGDLRQGREGEVSEGSVVRESQAVCNRGQVVGREAGHHRVDDEAETTDRLQRRNRQSLDLTKLGDIGEFQLVHGDGHGRTIGQEDEAIRSIDQIRVQLEQLRVVGDLEGANSGNVETIQAAQASVGDGDVVGLGNARGAKSHGVQLRELLEVDLANGLQVLQLEVAQEVQPLQLKLAANLLQCRAGEAEKLGGVVDDQVTGDLLRTLQVQSAGQRRVDNDIGVDGLARDGRSVLGDGDILVAALG